MPSRLLTTSALAFLIAGPAMADCGQEIQKLEQAVTEAATGASGTDSGLPATEHQQAAMAGQQGDAATPAAGPAAAEGTDMPASPHQRQVLDGQGGQDGGAKMAGQEPAADLAKAQEMAEAGDEQGCMQQVGRIKDQLGLD